MDQPASTELTAQFIELFRAIPKHGRPSQPHFAVLQTESSPQILIGADENGAACVLIEMTSKPRVPPQPVRLENIEILFDIPCTLFPATRANKNYTVIRCHLRDEDGVFYFFLVAQSFLRYLGENPSAETITRAVRKIVELFQKQTAPPSRSAIGLFGELLLISLAHDKIQAINAWRSGLTDRYDFSEGNLRLEVKTTTGRIRSHKFSFEQCNPPSTTVCVIASILTEYSPTGVSIHELSERVLIGIEHQIEASIKVREIVATTLGSSVRAGIQLRFDESLALATIAFFDISSVPAIHLAPPGVNGIQFNSDLTGASPLTYQELHGRLREMPFHIPQGGALK